jgi:alpha-galactosidase
MKIKLLIIILSVACTIPVHAQKPGWAVVPPMGWNSWNCFGGNINEKLIMGIADAMVNSGMKEAGYEYVVIDDCWQLGRKRNVVNNVELKGRDSHGIILADTVKFPHGIKYVADYVHSKGLKFGLYTAPGVSSCAGYTGSQGYEELDINTFAEWGVDFIKLDWCGCTENDTVVLQRWRKLLNKTSRPIIFSANTGNLQSWLPKYGDMWRTGSDIQKIWASDPYSFKIFPGIADIFKLNLYSPVHQTVSGYNDPDMLQVGNIPDEDSKTHFSMWCMFGAPLIAGNDLRKMTPSIIKILTNPEAIAIDQDPTANQGTLVKEFAPGLELWAKNLYKYSEYAVILLNKGEVPAKMVFDYKDLDLKNPVFLRDVWSHSDLGMFSKPCEVEVPVHGCVMLKVVANEFPVKIEAYKIPVLPVGSPIQVEDSFFSFEAAKIDKTIPGYTGKGYLQGINHEWCVFSLRFRYELETQGNYKIDIRYNLPGKEDLNYTLNNAKVTFKPTGKEWKIVSADVNLAKGFCELILLSKSCTSNNVAIDAVTVTPK